MDSIGNNSIYNQLNYDLEVSINKDLNNLMPKILKGERGEGIVYLKNYESIRVFTLEKYSDLVFKVNLVSQEAMKKRYINILKAQEIGRNYNLNLLVIPPAKLCTINYTNSTSQEESEDIIITEYDPDATIRDTKNLSDDESMTRFEEISKHEDFCDDNPIVENSMANTKFNFLIEQKLEFDNKATKMNYDYPQSYYGGEKLIKANKQLTKFICLTGYSDSKPSNNPYLNCYDVNGNQMIAAFDLEDMDSVAVGLEGSLSLGRKGFLNQLPPETKQLMLKQVRKYSNLWMKEKLEDEKSERNQNLYNFYAKRNIVIGNEIIHSDKISNKPFGSELLAMINSHLQRGTFLHSIKRQRQFPISWLSFYDFNNVDQTPEKIKDCLSGLLTHLVVNNLIFRYDLMEDRPFFLIQA